MTSSDIHLSGAPSFSVVVPVYQCVECLEALCERLEQSLLVLTKKFEIILVDDRSFDDSWRKILELQAFHPNVKGIRLSRNFGQGMAILAGMEEAVGDLIVVMDCDLQDPPEKIADLYAKAREGFDVVVGRRSSRSHSFFRVWAAKLFFGILNKISGQKYDGSYGSFSLLSRKAVNGFLRLRERDRHFQLILQWIGFERGVVDYEHQPREAGKSSYSFATLVQHAANGIFFHSTEFLRWIVRLGLLYALGGAFLAIYLSLNAILGSRQPGWTSLAVLMLINTGAILVSLGVVGLYISKIFDQVKDRPLFIVDERLERKTQW